MNVNERKDPDLLDSHRRWRIARGAGVSVGEVDQFVKQFEVAKNMMRQVRGR